jgi:biotin transport system substrate-specific component
MMAATLPTMRSTLADRALRGEGMAYHLALVIGGSLFVALLAQIAIPVPFSPVPITGQTYAVLLVGALLGSRRGALSLLLYLVEGGLGLPFFSGGAAGWARVLGPTGGYLLGFVLAAFVVGWLAERGWDRRLSTAAIAMLAGNLVIYLVGVAVLAVFVGAAEAVPLGLLPFLPGDMLKILLAAATMPAGWRLLGLIARPSE